MLHCWDTKFQPGTWLQTWMRSSKSKSFKINLYFKLLSWSSQKRVQIRMVSISYQTPLFVCLLFNFPLENILLYRDATSFYCMLWAGKFRHWLNVYGLWPEGWNISHTTPALTQSLYICDLVKKKNAFYDKHWVLRIFLYRTPTQVKF